jgi:GT2 family glycosyltransferase
MGNIVDIHECVASLRASSTTQFDVLVVENCKESSLTDHDADVESIVTGGNIGFAKGNNFGIKASVDRGYFATFLLNDDVVLDPDAIKLLLHTLRESKDIGLAAPVTAFYRQPGSIWAAGGDVFRWRVRVYGRKTAPSRLQEVGYLPGAAVMFKNSLVQSVGLLPTKYFFAYEEAEYCLRAKGMGYRSVVQPAALAQHKVGITSRSGPVLLYNDFRNRFLFSEFLHGRSVGRMIGNIICKRELIRHRYQSSLVATRAWQDHIRYEEVRLEHLQSAEHCFGASRSLQFSDN